MKVTKIKEVICLSNGRCYGNRRWELVQINVYNIYLVVDVYDLN